MAWAISLHYVWVEAVHAEVLVPSGAREPWLNLTCKMAGEDKFAGHMTALTQQKLQCSGGRAASSLLMHFPFTFTAVLQGLQQRQLPRVGVSQRHWGAVVPGGWCCCALLLPLGFLLPALWSREVVSLRGWFSSIKNSILSSGTLLAED